MFFAVTGSGFTILLVVSAPGRVEATLGVFMLAQIGFVAANVFYDARRRQRADLLRISGMSDRPDEPAQTDAGMSSPETEQWAPPPATEAPSPPKQPGGGIPWLLTLVLLLTVAVVIFAVQNTQDVQLGFLGWSWRLPLAIVILIAVVVTVILDQVLGGIIKRQRARRRRERAELQRLRDQSS